MKYSNFYEKLDSMQEREHIENFLVYHTALVIAKVKPAVTIALNKRKKGKQFKTVMMTQKTNFEDINKVNKMKKDFINSVDHYEYCNTVGNEKMKHKYCASFIVGSSNKIE